MSVYLHRKGAKRVNIEIVIGENSFFLNVWAKFARDAESAVKALFDSCRNPHCSYFQNRLAAIELAFGY